MSPKVKKDFSKVIIFPTATILPDCEAKITRILVFSLGDQGGILVIKIE